MTGTSVFFEAVLALATGVSVLGLWRRGFRACAFGLSFVAAAAALGALLFADVSAVDAPHALITRWAAVAGFPAFGGFALWRRLRGEPAWPMAALTVAVLAVISSVVSAPIYPIAIGSLALLCLLAVAFADIKTAPRRSATLIVACLLTALAGLLIGTEGRWGPLPRVDWYHLALTLANLGFGWALVATNTATKTA